MCISATGSFVASGALAAAGGATLWISDKEERLIAAIPLAFALQQAIEGVQWLVPHPGVWSLMLGYGYLFFAFLFWPAYLPVAVYWSEENIRRRRDLRWFMAIGAVTSLVLLIILFVRPLTVNVYEFGIDYEVAMPFSWAGVLVYAAATCGSLIISSRMIMQWFGVAGIASGLLSAAIFQRTFFSTWCFFAAALCVFVFFIVHMKRIDRKKMLTAASQAIKKRMTQVRDH